MEHRGFLVLDSQNLAFLQGRRPHGGAVGDANFSFFLWGGFTLFFVCALGESLFSGRYNHSVIWSILSLCCVDLSLHSRADVRAKKQLYESGVLKEGRITIIEDIAYGEDDGFRLTVTFDENVSTRIIVNKKDIYENRVLETHSVYLGREVWVLYLSADNYVVM